jgi:EAL and modified HD-GYP domain-containing signal transduction protein
MARGRHYNGETSPLNSNQSPSAEVIDHISIARQPIVDGDRNIVAYELFNRSRLGARHTVASDISLALNAVANQGSPFSIANSTLFVHSLHDGLDGSHWDFLDPQRVVASVPPVENHDPQRIADIALALERLRGRGVRLCFHHMVVAPLYKSWQPLADFVKVDLKAVQDDKLTPLLGAIRARTTATPIAMKVETQAQFDELKSKGVTRFQGYLFSAPEVVKPRVLAPGEVVALELFNLATQSASVDQVEEVLKKDAALGVNLLRIINSASMNLNGKVTSLRQAVMLMGYEKLSKWAALAMATASDQNSSLVKSSAIVRARMMELLAQSDTDHFEPGTAFLIGLLSRIDAMLGCPMQSALAQLSLSEEIVELLLGGQSAYGELLALVKACESEDDDDFARAFSKLNFTLRQINIAQMEALAWSDGALA